MSLEPSDCPPATSRLASNRAGTTWTYRDARKLADPPSACGLTSSVIRKAKGNKIKFQLTAKSDVTDACSYDFPRPGGTLLRQDVVIGDECATVMFDCRVFGGSKTDRCTPWEP